MNFARALLGLVAAIAVLSSGGLAAQEHLRTRHFEYRILGFRIVEALGAYVAPQGHRLAVVEFEARNLDDEPRAVFIGTLRAERAGVVTRFEEPQPVPGIADKMFSELRVGERETLRFGYEVPASTTAGTTWSWEPARSGSQRLMLPPPTDAR